MKTIYKFKSLFLLIIIASNIITFNSLQAQSLSGRDIMQKVIDRPDGENRKSKLEMELINKRGSKRKRTVITYSMDIGKDKKNLMFFLEPSDVKGTSFLTWEYDNLSKEDDRWLYLPAMKKTRRISGTSAKKDYFMGTDFTYDDLGTKNIDENKYKLLKEITDNNRQFWIVESIPVDPRDMYSKIISYIDKVHLLAHKVEFYDKKGSLLKTLEVSDIIKIDGFWTAQKMHMVNHQQKHETILNISNTKYNINIDQDLFSVSNMEKGIIE